MKPVVIDASSAILLYKSELIPHLVSLYQTRIADSVYHEITCEGYSGSIAFRRLCDRGQIAVLPEIDSRQAFSEAGIPALDPGERDTIHHFLRGSADFIILDDGRAARYCRKAELPFINALLFPRILFLINIIQESDYHQKRVEIINNGRYSDHIIRKALELPIEEMQLFLPGSRNPAP